MQNIKKSAFTLIEFVIVVTIFFILVSISYIPYNYYINKAKVRSSVREISQSLYEARNMAINGISSNSNTSVGLYIDSENASNKLQFFSYPYSYTQTEIINSIGGDIKLIKTYELQPNINIIDIGGEGLTAGQTKGLFFFESISGNGSYFYWDSSGNKNDIQGDEILINISYKNAPIGSPLSGKLTYFTTTNIVDY